MAGEYDEKFEEITGLLQKNAGLLQKTVGGLEELRMEVRDIRNDLRENVKETKSIGQKLDVFTRHFQDVGGLVLKDHHPRIESLEERLDVLESRIH